MSRNLLIFIALIFFATKSFAQIVRTSKIDTTSNWKKVNKVGLDFTQISFVNWSAGGNNSISGLAKELIVSSLELDEDLALSKLADERLKNTKNWVNHTDAWK